jgi:hypothetical protein
MASRRKSSDAIVRPTSSHKSTVQICDLPSDYSELRAERDWRCGYPIISRLLGSVERFISHIVKYREIFVQVLTVATKFHVK